MHMAKTTPIKPLTKRIISLLPPLFWKFCELRLTLSGRAFGCAICGKFTDILWKEEMDSFHNSQPLLKT